MHSKADECVGLKRQTYYAKCGGFSVPLYNLDSKVQRLGDRTVSVALVKKLSSTQKSTRDTPEKVTFEGLINHEKHHHRLAFDADEYCWLG